MFVQAFGGRIVEPSARSRGDHDPERRDQNFDTHSYTEAASVGGLFRNFEPQTCRLRTVQHTQSLPRVTAGPNGGGCGPVGEHTLVAGGAGWGSFRSPTVNTGRMITVIG